MIDPKKIKDLVDLKEIHGFKIMIDGSCSPEIVKELSDMGCDGFILGTSALFGKEESYKTLINNLRNM